MAVRLVAAVKKKCRSWIADDIMVVDFAQLQDPHFPTLHQYPGNGIGGSTRGGFSQMQRDILDGNDEMIRPRDYLPSESCIVSPSLVLQQSY